MVFPFSSKKPENPQRAYIPVNLVQRYASQGIPEREIAARLRSQGFVPGQIDAAIRAVLRERVAGPQRGPPERAPMLQERQPAPDEFPTMQMGTREQRGETGEATPLPPRREPQRIEMPQQMPAQETEPEPRFTFEGGQNPLEPALGEVTLEEIIEGIVAEKWNDFEDRLANFEERDLQLQQQIQEVRHSIKDVEKAVESKEQTLSGRFDEFSGSVSEIQGRIGSMEKVFKEFIPELAKNVKTLSEATRN